MRASLLFNNKFIPCEFLIINRRKSEIENRIYNIGHPLSIFALSLITQAFLLLLFTSTNATSSWSCLKIFLTGKKVFEIVIWEIISCFPP